MLKEAGHLEKVKRLRISDEDLAPLTPHYEVRNLNIVNVTVFDIWTQVALNKLKEFYTRQQT